MGEIEEKIDWSDEALLLGIGEAELSHVFGAEEPGKKRIIEEALKKLRSVKFSLQEAICSDQRLRSIVSEEKYARRVDTASVILDIIILNHSQIIADSGVPPINLAVLISRTSLFEYCENYWTK